MQDCPFCRIGQDEEENIVLENDYCLFIQKASQQQVLEGSGLIIPRSHREDVFQLTREEWNATYDLLQQAKPLLDAQHAPDGYTLGWNVGPASNQEIYHAHFHVIPRFMDEPYAGRGLRYWLKQESNRRPGRERQQAVEPQERNRE